MILLHKNCQVHLHPTPAMLKNELTRPRHNRIVFNFSKRKNDQWSKAMFKSKMIEILSKAEVFEGLTKDDLKTIAKTLQKK